MCIYHTFYSITDIDYILEQIRDKNVKKIVHDNFEFQVVSVRLQTFATKGVDCICCGAKGHHFQAETSSNTNMKKLHINLYAKRKNGTFVLMTRDHIIPRSAGGEDTVENMSPMCAKCNSERGNFIDQSAFITAYRKGLFDKKNKCIKS